MNQTRIEKITAAPDAHHTTPSLVITTTGTETANSAVGCCQPVQAVGNPTTDAIQNTSSSEGAGTNRVFDRPGITDAFLSAAGCRHVGENDSVHTFGFKAAGIAIPFHGLDGTALVDEGKPFARVRLYDQIGDQKYSQRHGSAEQGSPEARTRTPVCTPRADVTVKPAVAADRAALWLPQGMPDAGRRFWE